MQGTISSFKRGKHVQTNNQMVVVVEGVDDRKKAAPLVGKEVVFKTESGKEIKGKVASAHGNSGALRVLFEKGMPGQSLGKTVEIKLKI
jgi:large subunit ribosomal protein L35Ae